jgi:hypothetical protein
VTAADLSGTWSWGQEVPEPSPGPKVACVVGNPLVLSQQGKALTGHADVCGGPCMQGAPLTGTVTENMVVLSSDAEKFQLTFDPKTQHLVGTRNGKPFWAVPFKPSGAPECANIVQ